MSPYFAIRRLHADARRNPGTLYYSGNSTPIDQQLFDPPPLGSAFRQLAGTSYRPGPGALNAGNQAAGDNVRRLLAITTPRIT